MRRLTSLALGTFMYGFVASGQAQPLFASGPDCIDQAARYHGVNDLVLRAIAYHESGMRSWAQRRNTNGSYDIGLMQINTVHLPELSRMGVAPAHLHDACVSAFVGAWLYRRKIAVHQNTWTAVGAYHSETPELRSRYALAIHAIVQRWLSVGGTQVSSRTDAIAVASHVVPPAVVLDEGSR